VMLGPLRRRVNVLPPLSNGLPCDICSKRSD
jgi:hypothetical protein